MNYNESLNFLYSLQKSGIKFGLNNTIKLLEQLGNPHHKFKSIHIAGTNGKGSTCSFISSILYTMNFKVGLYTSPHLVRFNERIRINGNEIEDEYLIKMVEALKKTIEEIKPTFFEVTTAIAFKYFADHKVDYAVIETGLGGRLDSTNVITPEISVITKVDYDHKEFLGEKLENIAFEKGGIIKPGVPVIVAKNNEQVKELLKKIAIERKSRILFTDEHYSSQVLGKRIDGYLFLIKSSLSNKVYQIKSPLIGDFQIENIINVIATFEVLFPDRELQNVISLGIEKMKFPIQGRFQVVRSTPVIILDTAHNSDAIKNFIFSLNSLVTKPKVAVFGIMKDKEINDTINLIENSFEKIYLCQASTERSLNVNLLSEKFSNSKVEKFDSVEGAIEKALTEPDKIIAIFGSNYIVGEAIEYLRRKKFL
ncbi:MAG: bifunctional folylpolyglutamate synthase/dihydrofolate synthase [Ignavibacteria bacterium]